jgi:hypothetical protein
VRDHTPDVTTDIDAYDAPLFPIHLLAKTDAARLRGWFWGLLWADLLARGGRRLAYKAFLKLPARSARIASNGVRRHGAAAREATGVSLPIQFARLWWSNVRHGITADTFYRYQLFRPDRWPRTEHFVQRSEAARLYRVVAANTYQREVETVADKRRFAAWCAVQGLPTIPVVMEFDAGRLTRDATTLGLPPAADLFSKAAAGQGGRGARRWRHVGNHVYDGDGRQWTATELVAELAAQSAEGPVIVQECQTNHPAVSPIAPSALGTLRVMTIRPPGQAARLLLAVYRMPVRGATMDNYTQGGIVSPVDGRTGELGTAIRPDAHLRMLTFPTHPDTGAAIVGARLPYWSESMELAVRAHDALGEIPCIGWDIAPLAGGPVLVEGNWNPGVMLAQMPSGIPLGETEFVSCILAHLRRSFPRPDWSWIRKYSEWQPTEEIKHSGRDHASIVTVE